MGGLILASFPGPCSLSRIVLCWYVTLEPINLVRHTDSANYVMEVYHMVATEQKVEPSDRHGNVRT